MIWLTDVTGIKIAINPNQVVAVFTMPEGTENAGRTSIKMIDGQLFVTESDYDVVGMINND